MSPRDLDLITKDIEAYIGAGDYASGFDNSHPGNKAFRQRIQVLRAVEFFLQEGALRDQAAQPPSYAHHNLANGIRRIIDELVREHRYSRGWPP